MEQAVIGSLCLFLGICTWTDLKSREIWRRVAVLFALVAISLNIILAYISWLDFFGGILIGVFILGIGFIMKQAIGYGDGMMICVTGMYLGLEGNIELVLRASVLTALVGKLFLKEKEIPFAPFLLVVYVGGLIGKV